MVRVVGPLRVVTDRPLLVSQVRVRAARDRAEQGGLTAAFDDAVPVQDGQLDMTVLPGPAVMMLEVTGGFSHAVALVVPDVAEVTLEQCVTAAQVAGETDRRTLERLAGEVARDAAAVAGSLRAAADSAEAAGVARAGAEEALSAAVRESTDASEFAADAEVAQREAAGSAERAAASERNAGEHASEAARAEVAAQGHEDAAAGSARDAAGSAERAATIAGSTRWVGTQVEVNGKLSPELMPEITISDSGTWVVEGTDTGVRAQGEQGPAGDGASTWEDIAGKPTTFTPVTHSHEIGDVNGLLARFGEGGSVPTATGDQSMALGHRASARGVRSMAMGSGSAAGQDYGMALGSSASARGVRSMALGAGASTWGDYSTALGNGASATGTTAQALSASSTATKNSHTVIGVRATDENIPTNIDGTVVVGKAGVPVYLAGRDVLAELDTGLAEARAYADALIVEGNTSATDGKLHIVYE